MPVYRQVASGSSIDNVETTIANLETLIRGNLDRACMGIITDIDRQETEYDSLPNKIKNNK